MNSQHDNLRETYNRYASERDAGVIPDWKIGVRADFLSVLQQEHKTSLLEIGAGTGKDSKFFHDHGFETTSIDLSPVMVGLCKQKGLHALVMDVCALQFPASAFDAVYALNSLLHLTKVEVPQVLQQINLLLKPDGLFYLGVYGGYDHEGVWDKDTYSPQRFFSFFSDDHLREEVTKVFDIHLFKCITFEPDDPIHFQSLILRKMKE